MRLQKLRTPPYKNTNKEHILYFILNIRNTVFNYQYSLIENQFYLVEKRQFMPILIVLMN